MTTYPTRATLLTIDWADDLPDEEVLRLSRAWAATISGKPVVAKVRLQIPPPPPPRPGLQSTERRRYRLQRQATWHSQLNFKWFVVGTASPKARWCYGCAATIPAGDPHARDGNDGRVCMACIEAATLE